VQNRMDEDRQRLHEKYSRLQSEAARKVERAVLGHDVGLSGFTTVEQAESLRRHLTLRREDVLLDVGAGRGWPGTHLASSSGCRLVSADTPRIALSEARARFARCGLGPGSAAVAAEGQDLPFRSASFDAISHADVFC